MSTEKNIMSNKIDHINISRTLENKLKFMLEFYNKGFYKDAEKLALSIIQTSPKDALSWKILGDIYFRTERLHEAFNAFRKSMKLNPRDPDNYIYIGVILKNLNKLEEAKSLFEFALKLNHNKADGYYNLGLVQKKLGKFQESVTNYKKAIEINPNNISYHINLANNFFELGIFKKATESLMKALEIDHTYIKAWNNIYFLLKIKDVVKKYNNSDIFLNIKNKLFNLDPLNYSLLDYRLNEDGKKSVLFFNKVLKAISAKNKLSIINPLVPKVVKKSVLILPKKIIALLHFGRSGTGLLHSLIDNHSQVSTLPSIYFSEFFDGAKWDKIIANGWDKIIDNFILNYPVFFDSRSPDAVSSINMKATKYLGVSEGMTNLGKNKNEHLFVNKSLFRKELKDLISFSKNLDPLTFFKMVHVAFERSIGNKKNKDIIFYHIHNPDTYAKLNFARLAPETKWLMMVRNPVESCESWISVPYKNNNYSDITMLIQTMLFGVNDSIFRNTDSIGVRLEDLKYKSKETILRICNWMGIKNENSLFEMTAQGKIWWGDKSSPHMPAFGEMPKSNNGKVFSKNDRFILETLFYPFNVSFGYVKEDLKKFKSDLEKIRPKINKMLDFEKVIAERTKVDCKKFVRSGHFLFLHSRMLERWKILNENNTYPEMIKPLKI